MYLQKNDVVTPNYTVVKTITVVVKNIIVVVKNIRYLSVTKVTITKSKEKTAKYSHATKK